MRKTGNLNVELILLIILICLSLYLVFVVLNEKHSKTSSLSADVITPNINTKNDSKNISDFYKAEPPTLSPQFCVGSHDPILLTEPNANFVGLYDGFIVKLKPTLIAINPDGFRDRNFSVEKPNGTFRIVALGDSHMFGLGVELNESFPKQLESLLNQNPSDYKYEVLNLGVPGYNTKQEVEFLKKKGLKYKPHLIILGYLGNDIVDGRVFQSVHQNFTISLSSLYSNLTNSTDIEKTADALNKILQQPQLAAYENITFEEAWPDVALPLAELKNLSEEFNFSVVILFYDCNNGPFFKEQTRALKDLSRKYGWLFVNLRYVNEKEPYEKMFLSRWDGHPTAYANLLYAEYALQRMTEADFVPLS